MSGHFELPHYSYIKIRSGVFEKGRSGAVDRASDFGPRGPWFDSPPVHILLWP